jgi:hypothetical protein
MSEIGLWNSFKLQTKPIKTIITILYFQYAFVVILTILMISTGNVGLLCLLLPYMLAHWVAEGVLMKSRFWHIFGCIYILFTSLVSSLFMIGSSFTVDTSGRTYLLYAPQTNINLPLALILILYGLWASVFLLLQIPPKTDK